MENWWKEAVVYQIYPRSFNDSNGDGIGDLRGIIEKIDYLADLGIDMVWLTPIYASPNDDNGYDISDYLAIMDEFGTMEDFDEMLEKFHQKGIKVIMDLVANHTSDEHEWFIEAKKSEDNPYRDFYIWKEGKPEIMPNNWRSMFGGPVWDYTDETDSWYLHLFSKKQPDLNWENPKMREALYDNIRWWLDKGVDGFRMDAINCISKVDGYPCVESDDPEELQWGGEYFLNGPRVHEFLQEMRTEVLDNYDVMTVGETGFMTLEQGLEYSAYDRKELDSVFQFELFDFFLAPGNLMDMPRINLAKIRNIITKWQVGFEGKAWNSLFLNNHDIPRQVSLFGNDKEYRVESAKMLATFLHTLKGTPYIFQGEEIGMTNVPFKSIDQYRDIATMGLYKELKAAGKTEEECMNVLHQRSRDNARTPMQWNNKQHAGFTTGTPWIEVNENYCDINVAQALQDPDSIYYYYKKLIELRKTHPIFVYGKYELILPNHDQIFAYIRSYEGKQLIVLLNFTDQNASFMLPADLTFTKSKLLISNYEVGMDNGDSLRPYEARIYQLS